MDSLIELLNHCEVTTILAMAVGFWLFNGVMNKKFEKINSQFAETRTELKGEIQEVRSDIRRLDSDIKELRTSLNRMEGAFYAKECCMLKNDNEEAKAK